MITIIDYGMGNLKSVENALKKLEIRCEITNDAEKIKKAQGIIIPGVGAFPDAMNSLREKKLDNVIKQAHELGKPILGICLGMQLLFQNSEEIMKCKGLGILKGSVKKIEAGVKIPHMGWNNLVFHKLCSLLKCIDEGSYVYFVHSYYAILEEEYKILNAYSDYGFKVPAIVSEGNTFGIQFHPEKSGDIGMRILKSFGELVG